MRIAAVILALGLATGGALAKTKPDPDVRLGRDVARRACAGCHAVEPAGRTSPRPKAAPFASREMRHTAGLEGRLARLTREGHYGMPPQTLSDAEVGGLMAYIESLGR